MAGFTEGYLELLVPGGSHCLAIFGKSWQKAETGRNH
jgi:hypothetical protein